MLPGKKYVPEDYVTILRHRIWWVLVPFAIVSAATAMIARTLPDLYYSETNILVVPQRVPEAYVRSTVTTRLEDRLQAIQPQILSRTRLEQIIQEFDLYAKERAKGELMEDVVVRMRREIRVTTEPAANSFRIGYTGQNPLVVQKVVNQLATLFINENLRDREVQAENTNQFIEAQLVDARRQLEDIEGRLAAYRQAHSGELPSQLDSNLQQVQNARTQIQTISESLNRDQERKIELERQLANITSLPAEGAAVTAPMTKAPQPQPMAGSTAQRLAAARANVKAYEVRGLKAGHPDLEAAKRVVKDLETALQAEVAGDGSGDLMNASPAEIERHQQIAATEERLAELNKQMEQKRTDLALFEKQAREYKPGLMPFPRERTS